MSHSYALFGYHLHTSLLQRHIPLDGVPSIPAAIARRWTDHGDDSLMSDLERRLCDDAIEAAKHVLWERGLKLKGGAA